MENAIDALKIAFAVFVFVMALTISITMFSQLNQVSKIVIQSSDITRFYTYENADANKSSRIVGLETIIPTLYKYYKENYTVLFLNQYGEPLKLYKSQTNVELWGNGYDPNNLEIAGNIAKYYTTNTNQYKNYDKNKYVCSFDVDEETTRHEPWTGADSDFKENLDAFLNGGTFTYPSGIGSYKYDGFIKEYNDNQFKETLGEYAYSLTEDDDDGNTLLKNRKKRVIIYQLQ